MSTPRFTRRALLRLFAGASGLSGSSEVRAEGPLPGDRGLGGTGAVPAERPGEDRGIGGTGVVGTIQRFGSIVVNGLRITYPPRVEVTIDGRAATLSDLALGQVVQTLARPHRGRLSTRSIAVLHEVVGPVEAVGRHDLQVLRQSVRIPPGLARPELRAGDWVAVSGLRRLDEAVEASRIERVRSREARVMGTVHRAAGAAQVGGLHLEGLDDRYVGLRVAIEGRMSGDSFEIQSVGEPLADLLAAGATHLSVETYISQRDGRVISAPGLGLRGAGPPPGDMGTGPAVLNARVRPDGSVAVEGVRPEGGAGPSPGHPNREGAPSPRSGLPRAGDPGEGGGFGSGPRGDGDSPGAPRGGGFGGPGDPGSGRGSGPSGGGGRGHDGGRR